MGTRWGRKGAIRLSFRKMGRMMKLLLCFRARRDLNCRIRKVKEEL